ncbi:MAG: hypothetical protein CVU88_02150, partial [Firmicutes bacterium HGW-Firmicutes-13]
MKRLLILGAGKEQVPAITRAKAKGIYTIVLDMNKEVEGFKYADESYSISIRDAEALINFVESYDKKIDGVITMASDIPHMVSRAAEKLQVRHIPVESADLTVEKFKMKETLLAAGVNIPSFKKINSLEELYRFISEHGYPVVIKPVDNSGARGVLRLTEGVDLEWAVNESKNNSRSGTVMVEKFLEGLQISTEGIMYEDKFYITGFADRNYENLDFFAPNIIEDGGDSPTRLNVKEIKLVNVEFDKAVRALGIDWGPGKGDMVFSNGKAFVIEIAARLSGGNFCYDHVPLGTGVDIVDVYIDMAVGNEIDVNCFKAKFQKGVAQRYFFPGTGKIKEITGLDKVKNMNNIVKIDFFAEEGDVIEKQVNHTTRVGYVIA